MDEDLSFLYRIPFELFMILSLIWIGIHFSVRSDLVDLNKNYAEITATTGGFTTAQYNDYINDLEEIGFASEDTIVTIQAFTPDGTDISNQAINVTPPPKKNESDSYPADPVYCPRGTKITLIVQSKKRSIINNVFSFAGSNSTISKGSDRKVYMSERVE